MRSAARYSVMTVLLLSQSSLGLGWQDLRSPFSFFSFHDQTWISPAKRAFESKKLPEDERRRYLEEKTEEKPGNVMIKYPVADLKNIRMQEETPDQLPFLSNNVNIEDSVEGNNIFYKLAYSTPLS